MAKQNKNKLSFKEDILLSCKYTRGVLLLGMMSNFIFIFAFVNELIKIKNWSWAFIINTLSLKALIILGGIYLQCISKK